MAKAFDINVKGIQQLAKTLKRKADAIDKELGKDVRRAAFFMQGEVKLSIAGRRAETRSVDSSFFLQTVTVKFKGPLIAEIFSPRNYAKYLEFGTSKIPARRHFRNSLNRNRGKIRTILKGGVARAVKK